MREQPRRRKPVHEWAKLEPCKSPLEYLQENCKIRMSSPS